MAFKPNYNNAARRSQPRAGAREEKQRSEKGCATQAERAGEIESPPDDKRNSDDSPSLASPFSDR